MDSLPWSEKFRPKTIKEVVGNSQAITMLKHWILSWEKEIPKKRAALLVGPPGIGKTTTVLVLAKELDMEIVEFNASDKRNKEIMENIVWRAATQQTLDGRPRLILLDEIDGLSGTGDRGGTSALVKIIGQTVHPIVMTANDIDSPRIKDLLKVCKIIQFEPLKQEDIMVVLEHVLKKANLDLNLESLTEITENAGGDLRAAISDLELTIEGKLKETFGRRDIARTTSQYLQRVFLAMDYETLRRVVSEIDMDYEELLLWLEENVPHHRLRPEELSCVFDAFSKADIILGRIYKNQNWKLLSYFYDLISAGIISSRLKTPFRKIDYRQPEWPLLVWKGNRINEKRSKIVEHISVRTGVSISRAIHTQGDMIIQLATINQEIATSLAEWLGVTTLAFENKIHR